MPVVRLGLTPIAHIGIRSPSFAVAHSSVISLSWNYFSLEPDVRLTIVSTLSSHKTIHRIAEMSWPFRDCFVTAFLAKTERSTPAFAVLFGRAALAPRISLREWEEIVFARRVLAAKAGITPQLITAPNEAISISSPAHAVRNFASHTLGRLHKADCRAEGERRSRTRLTPAAKQSQKLREWVAIRNSRSAAEMRGKASPYLSRNNT